jgi:hypothetical protein
MLISDLKEIFKKFSSKKSLTKNSSFKELGILGKQFHRVNIILVYFLFIFPQHLESAQILDILTYLTYSEKKQITLSRAFHIFSDSKLRNPLLKAERKKQTHLVFWSWDPSFYSKTRE